MNNSINNNNNKKNEAKSKSKNTKHNPIIENATLIQNPFKNKK